MNSIKSNNYVYKNKNTKFRGNVSTFFSVIKTFNDRRQRGRHVCATKLCILGDIPKHTRQKAGLQCYLTPWSLLTNYSRLKPLVGNFLTL